MRGFWMAWAVLAVAALAADAQPPLVRSDLTEAEVIELVSVPADPLPEVGSAQAARRRWYLFERGLMLEDAERDQGKPLSGEQRAMIDGIAGRLYDYAVAPSSADLSSVYRLVTDRSGFNRVIAVTLSELSVRRSVDLRFDHEALLALRGVPEQGHTPHPIWYALDGRDELDVERDDGPPLTDAMVYGAVWSMQALDWQFDPASTQLAAEAGARAITNPRGRERSAVYLRFNGAMTRGEQNDELARLTIRELERSGSADEWLTAAFTGYNHESAAWDARGSGYANTVSDEGWRIYRREMSSAEREVRRAMEIAPGEMLLHDNALRLAYQGFGYEGDRRRQNRAIWAAYSRGIAVAPDYYPMHWAAYWGLRPRWAGSLDDLRRLIRWQTSVLPETGDARAMSVYTLQALAEDSSSFESVWGDEEVMDMVIGTFDALAAKAREGPIVTGLGITSESMYETTAAILEHWAGRTEEARSRLERIDFETDVRFGLSDVWFDRFRAAVIEIAGTTGPRADAIDDAIALLPSGDEFAAMALLAPDSELIEQERRYLEGRIDRVRIARARAEGDPLDIVGLFEPELGFAGATHEWTRDEGAEGETTARVALDHRTNWQNLTRSTPMRFRIRARYTPESTDGDPRVSLIWRDVSVERAARVQSIGSGEIRIDDNKTDGRGGVVAYDGAYPVEIEFEAWDGAMRVTVGGEETYVGRPDWLAGVDARSRGSLEMFVSRSGWHAEFEELTYQSLRREPEWHERAMATVD